MKELTYTEICDLLDNKLKPIYDELQNIKISLKETDKYLSTIDKSLDSIEQTFSNMNVVLENFNKTCKDNLQRLQSIH